MLKCKKIDFNSPPECITFNNNYVVQCIIYSGIFHKHYGSKQSPEAINGAGSLPYFAVNSSTVLIIEKNWRVSLTCP